MALFFAPMAMTLATSIASRTIGKVALKKAMTTYGKPFIQTLQNIGKNKDKVSKTVKKFNDTNKNTPNQINFFFIYFIFLLGSP